MALPNFAPGDKIYPGYMRQIREWPKCSSDYVFLWEALSIAGRALLGDDWNGEEISALDWPTSPLSDFEEHRRRTAEIAINAHRLTPLQKTRWVIPDALRPTFHQHVIDYRHNHTAEQLQQRWRDNQNAIQRLAQATEWLHEKFRNGKIDTFSRFEGGALDVLRMEPSEWFVEQVLETRFRNGGYKRVFVTASNQAAYDVFIFVDRAALEREISILPHTSLSISGTDISNLSPYLRFAVAFALANEDDIARGSREWAEQAIMDGWNNANPDDPMTPTMAKRMSYVVRFHDSEAIAYGQKRGAAKPNGATPKPT